MINTPFKALRVHEIDGTYPMTLEDRFIEDLKPGDLLVKVAYSSLNYKDALSCFGNKGVTRSYPHTPGIDAVGTVVESSSHLYREGDPVIVTSFDLGMNTDGGFGSYIRVPSQWAVPLPEDMGMRDSMVYGTAGFTAALSVLEIVQAGVRQEDGPILVTGGNGGVGHLAIAILNKLGYHVTTSTGRLEHIQSLENLGAKEVIHRNDVIDPDGKALLSSKWAAVVDTVGGQTLAYAVKSTNYRGVVTCCGNVGGADFESSVYPFILRGVRLIGIDSGRTPMAIREQVWNHLATDWRPVGLESMATDIELDQLVETITSIYKGSHRGRTVLK